MVVILIPNPDDPEFAEYWRCDFDRYAKIFATLGAECLAIPWYKAPLSVESSLCTIYIANLVWGYHFVSDRWIAWLHAWPENKVLINSKSLLLWSTCKIYLKKLEEAGVPVIPTFYVDQVDEKTLKDAATRFGTHDIIVKPQVGGSSHNIVRVLIDSDDFASSARSMSVTEAIDQLRKKNADSSPMMIQPFLPSVNGEGETSVLVFDGKVSHVVSKQAPLNGYWVQIEHGGFYTTIKQPSEEILEVTRQALSACPEMPVYARVDMIRNDKTGRLCVSELELIEPDLYFEHMNDNGEAFARAVLDKCPKHYV